MAVTEEYREQAVNGAASAIIDRIFGPARAMVPGLILLLVIALVTVAAGMINVFDPPYRGDRTVLFMLATGAYPGPYMFYGLFSFLLIHAHPTPRMKAIFYASCVALAAAPIVALIRHLHAQNLSFGRRLDEALFANMVASVAIGAIFLAIMAVIVVATRWMETDSD